MNLKQKYFSSCLLVIILTLIACDVSIKKQKDVIKDEPTKSLVMVRDTSNLAINLFDINFPEEWEAIPKYKGAVLMGISPLDSLGSFRENISVQVFNISEYFDSEEVASYLFSQLVNDVDSNYKVFNKELWESDNGIEFYKINYQYSFNNVNVKSLLFTTVNKERAYVLVCTSSPEKFEKASIDAFYPSIQSFKLD